MHGLLMRSIGRGGVVRAYYLGAQNFRFPVAAVHVGEEEYPCPKPNYGLPCREINGVLLDAGYSAEAISELLNIGCVRVRVRVCAGASDGVRGHSCAHVGVRMHARHLANWFPRAFSCLGHITLILRNRAIRIPKRMSHLWQKKTAESAAPVIPIVKFLLSWVCSHARDSHVHVVAVYRRGTIRMTAKDGPTTPVTIRRADARQKLGIQYSAGQVCVRVLAQGFPSVPCSSTPSLLYSLAWLSLSFPPKSIRWAADARQKLGIQYSAGQVCVRASAGIRLSSLPFPSLLTLLGSLSRSRSFPPKLSPPSTVPTPSWAACSL